MTPVVHPSARIAEGVHLGPGCVVGAGADIGPDCVLHPYAIVGPHTTLGPGCHVYSFAVIGADAQDRRTPPGAPTRLVCGAGSLFREHATVSRGSVDGGGLTTLGERALVMAGAHVGHDCHLGEGVTLANNVSLAGHVTLGARASLGGHAAVHQFVRIGELAFIAANAMVSQDVPPYCLAAGDRARLFGLNVVGLERAGFDTATRAALKRALRGLLGPANRGAPPSPEASDLDHPEVRALRAFIEGSTRGVCRLAGPSQGVDAEDAAD